MPFWEIGVNWKNPGENPHRYSRDTQNSILTEIRGHDRNVGP